MGVESGEERNEKFVFRVESEAWREIERERIFLFFGERERKKLIK